MLTQPSGAWGLLQIAPGTLWPQLLRWWRAHSLATSVCSVGIILFWRAGPGVKTSMERASSQDANNMLELEWWECDAFNLGVTGSSPRLDLPSVLEHQRIHVRTLIWPYTPIGYQSRTMWLTTARSFCFEFGRFFWTEYKDCDSSSVFPSMPSMWVMLWYEPDSIKPD